MKPDDAVSMKTETEFESKKAAKEARYLSLDQWFKKYRVPYRGEPGIEFRGEEYFREFQAEELFSKSKGAKEIGPLKLGAQSVGQKKYRTVRFQVYRESDFILEEKIVRKIEPARTIDLIDAIAKVNDTAVGGGVGGTGVRKFVQERHCRRGTIGGIVALHVPRLRRTDVAVQS